MISRLLAGVLFLVGVVASVADAAILHGPVINPANGRAYYLLEADTWQGSAVQANALGGHLVVINDQTENEWVLATFGRYGGAPRNLWLGLSDAAKEGTFEWMTREPLSFTAWKAGEPDNSQAGENYAFIHAPTEEGQSGAGTWGDTLDAGDGGQITFHGIVEAEPLENDDLARWMVTNYSIWQHPWALGWRNGPTGQLQLFSYQNEIREGLRVWKTAEAEAPNGRVNFDPEPHGSLPVQPYELVLEPGPNGKAVEAVYKAPMTGNFVVAVSFTDIDIAGEGQDVRVYIEDQEVFSATINAAQGSARAEYTSPVPVHLMQDQRVSVKVSSLDSGNEALGCSTRVDASIRYVNTPLTYYKGGDRFRLDDNGNLVITSGATDFTYDPSGAFLSAQPAAPLPASSPDYTQVADGKISKYRGSDGQLLWSTSLDPVFTSRGVGIQHLDTKGNVLLIGRYEMAWAPSSIFYCVEKYAAADGHLLWRTTLSFLFKGGIDDLVTDSQGDVVAVGRSAYDSMHIWKLSGTSGERRWSRTANNPFGEIAWYGNSSSFDTLKCSFDSFDNPVVTGAANGVPVGPDYDLYAAKYDATQGNQFWQRRARAAGINDWRNGLVAKNGDILLISHGFFLRYKAPPIDDQHVTFLSHTEAMLHARVRVSDPQAKVYAEYGTDANYGMRSPEVPVSADGVASVLLSGLTAPKVYYYRLVVETSDGMIEGEAQTFDMTKAPNQAPVAREDAYSEPAEGALTEFVVDALANDSDPEGDPIHIFSVTQGQYGAVTTDGGKVIYTPAAGFVADAFTYTIADSYGAKATATITVRRSSEQPPVTMDDFVQVNVGPVEFNALANDHDPEGKALKLVGVTQPANGTVSFLSDGRLWYAPAANFSGQDQFTYTVSDGILRSTGTVRVTVSNPDRPPIALDDAKEVGSGKSRLWWILSNDRDPDGKTLYIQSYTQPAPGTGTLAGTSWVNSTWFSGYRDLEYTPPVGFSGEVEFTYVITDGSLTAEATVRLTVNGGATPENKPPLAQGDYATAAPHPSSTDIWCLANDSDPEGATLTISSFTQPTNGSVVSVSGRLRYTPNPGFVGEDQFTYVVSDGSLTAQATVRVTVEVNLPPVAVDDAAQSGAKGVRIDVRANDSDPEGKPLTVRMLDTVQPAHGSVTYEFDGRLYYRPHPRFVGTDQFTYTVSDGVLSSTATVTVSVVADDNDEDVTRAPFFSDSNVKSPWFRRFGLPSINDRGDVAFQASFSDKLNTHGKVVSGVFVHTQSLTWITRKGRRAFDTTGLRLPNKEVFRSFQDPLLNGRGDVAFLAKISRSSVQRDSGIWIKPAEGPLRMVVREGDPATGVDGARLGTFISLGLTDSGAVPFVAKLRAGKGGVTPKNTLGLWITTESGTHLLLRQGDTIEVGGASKQVKLFAALTTPSNSPGHERLGAGEALLVRVTWSDKTHSILRVSPSTAPEVLVSSGDEAPGTAAKFASFGLPSPDHHGGFAISATLQGDGVTSTNDVCVYACTAEGSWELLARESEVEALELERSQPVRNAEGRTAFLLTSRTSGAEEIWSAEDGMVFAEGEEQPSSQPRSVVSLAYPGGEHGGAVYLARSESSASGKKKSKKVKASRVGLWAIDGTGTHHLLCEAGEKITVSGQPKTIRAIDTLRAVPGSAAQPRSYNSKGQIVYRLTFTDGSQAIFQRQLP